MTDDQQLGVRVCAVEYQWMGDVLGFWDKKFDHETELRVSYGKPAQPALPTDDLSRLSTFELAFSEVPEAVLLVALVPPAGEDKGPGGHWMPQRGSLSSRTRWAVRVNSCHRMPLMS